MTVGLENVSPGDQSSIPERECISTNSARKSMGGRGSSEGEVCSERDCLDRATISRNRMWKKEGISLICDDSCLCGAARATDDHTKSKVWGSIEGSFIVHGGEEEEA